MSDPVFRALLIGVDFYFPNELPDGSSYRSLNGCVKDVARVEAVIRGRITLPIEVTTLTSSNLPGQSAPPEAEALRPTYRNLKLHLDGLVGRAQAGDQVFIHYSGHGGRVLTRFPDLHGEGGVDETLVPIDIGDTSTRYVRDVDLAYYLDALARKGAITTLLFDSCHSGGTTRGLGFAVRRATGGRADGGGPIDTTKRPEGGVAPDDELSAAWTRLRSSAPAATRGAVVRKSLLPDGKGYVLLAACSDTESAIEAALDGKQRGGVMTDAFLDTLALLGPGQTWKTMHERVLARVHSRFDSQTPQLVGEGNREIFGSSLLPAHFTMNVAEIDVPGRRVKIDGGLAMGLRVGVEIGIYPLGVNDAPVAASAVLDDVGAIEAWATLGAQASIDLIQQGAPVVVLDLPLRYKVHLARRDDLPLAIDQTTALAAVAAALPIEGHGVLEASGDGEIAHFQVVLDAAGRYEIGDPKGIPLPNLAPIPAGEARSAARLVDRLVALGRYGAVLDIHGSSSQMDANIGIEMRLVPPAGAATPADSPAPAREGDAFVVAVDRQVEFLMSNKNDFDVQIAVLDLGADWSMSLLVPDEANLTQSVTVPANSSGQSVVQLSLTLPEGHVQTVEVLKFFVTRGHADFRWMVATPAVRGGLRPPPSPLVSTFDALQGTGNAGRSRGASSLGSDFAVRDVRVIIRASTIAARQPATTRRLPIPMS
jgi:hypothetical protein